jgi:glucose/arabinose transport system substrate-binding protein
LDKEPQNPPTKGINKMVVVIAIIIAVIVIASAVVIVVEERNSVTKAKPSNNVEFYTWWATEGKIALNKVGPAFHNKTGLTLSPYVSPGAGGSNAIYAILSLMSAGKPPATFQTHYGPGMLSYVEAASNGTHSFVNMGPVAQQMNLTNNSFSQVVDAGTFNGQMLSLPVDLHQGAQLYFNPSFLKKNKQPMPTNMQQLVNVTKNLSKMGVTAWIIPGGDGGWDQMNVWEDVFLSIAGNRMYDQLMYGNIPTTQMKTFYHDFNVTNSDYSIFQNDSLSGEASMTWTQAMSQVTQGKVGFQVNGNWYTNYAYDYLHTVNYPAIAPYDNNITAANITSSHAAKANGSNITLMSEDFPGSSKYYVMITDSVAVPKGPNQANGLTFAKYFASYSGNKIFAKYKATSFYKNLTSNIYNTPAQYDSHIAAASTPSKDWVYQLSDGGLFAGPLASFETAMTSFSESYTNTSSAATYGAASSVLDKSLVSILSTEKSDWLAANNMGLGYMGSPGHVFGGYLPPWANSTANTTVSSNLVTLHTNTDQQAVHKTSDMGGNTDSVTTFFFYLEGMEIAGTTIFKF